MSAIPFIAAPFYVAAGLLAVEGVVKLIRPMPARRALVDAGLPQGRLAVAALGLAQVAVGGAALISPGSATAWALAAMYAAFALFLVRLMRRAGTRSCGCLGSIEAPPSAIHIALNVIAVVAASAAVLQPPPSLWDAVRASPFSGVPFAFGLLSAGYLCFVAVAYLPAAWGAYRRHEHGDAVPKTLTLQPFGIGGAGD
jgi:hypothetical protein